MSTTSTISRLSRLSLRWSADLRRFLAIDAGTKPAAGTPCPDAEPRCRGHVLFVSRQRIVGKTNGSSAYLIDLAEAARKAGFIPHLLHPSPDIMGRWPVMHLGADMEVFGSQAIRGVLRYGNWVISRDPGVFLDAARWAISKVAQRIGLQAHWLADRPRPYSIAAPWQEADRRYLRRAGQHADIVIADYAFQAEALDAFPGRPGAIVMHDLFHRRTAGSEGRDSVAQLDRDSEIALLGRADAVIAIQADEARFIARNVPGVRPILAPIAAHPVHAPQPGEAGRLLFVGSNTAPNVLALEWLFESIWPLVKASAPRMRLDVVGTVAHAFAQGGPAGVTFHGMVNDLTGFYARAGVVISPLTFGSGLKVKLIEAMAQGKAIVATGITLQGVERECADAVIRADEAAQFAQGILALDRDAGLRLNMAQAALATAGRHFAPEACHAQFVAWLEDSRLACAAEAAGQ